MDLAGRQVNQSFRDDAEIHIACQFIADGLKPPPLSVRLISPEPGPHLFAPSGAKLSAFPNGPLYFQVLARGRHSHLVNYSVRLRATIAVIQVARLPSETRRQYIKYRDALRAIPRDLDYRVNQLLAMGYTRQAAEGTLMLAGYNVAEAVELLMDDRRRASSEFALMNSIRGRVPLGNEGNRRAGQNLPGRPIDNPAHPIRPQRPPADNVPPRPGDGNRNARIPAGGSPVQNPAAGNRGGDRNPGGPPRGQNAARPPHPHHPP